jgi:hypothetical protein
LVGVRGPSAACGDLSLDPGGIALGGRGPRRLRKGAAGRRAVGRRQEPVRVPLHGDAPLDGPSVVECTKPHPQRCRHRNDEAIAFVVRDTAAALDPIRQAIRPAAAAQPTEVEELPEDDALPRGEED